MEIVIPKQSEFITLSTDKHGNNMLTYDPMTNEYMSEWSCVKVPSGNWIINSIQENGDNKIIELINKENGKTKHLQSI